MGLTTRDKLLKVWEGKEDAQKAALEKLADEITNPDEPRPCPTVKHVSKLGTKYPDGLRQQHANNLQRLDLLPWVRISFWPYGAQTVPKELRRNKLYEIRPGKEFVEESNEVWVQRF